MSALTIGGDLIHYEVLGRGRPVLLLHGWVGSWRYWVPTMQQLQMQYRVYALDLFGFGDSSKNPQRYTIDHQVHLLYEFMDKMAIPKAAFIGHGLGALVTAMFARRYADRAPRILLVSAPLYDPGDLEWRVPATRTVSHLQNANLGADIEATIMTRPPVQAAMLDLQRARQAQESVIRKTAELSSPTARQYNPFMERDSLANIPPDAALLRCFRRTDSIYDKLALDLPKTDPAAVQGSVSNFDSGRFLDVLRLLVMQKVIVHGTQDPLIPVPSDGVLNYLATETENLPPIVPIIVPEVRHFPMLEYERFARLVTDFLELPDLTHLEVKERWKRRTR